MSQQIQIGEIIYTPDGQGKYKIQSKLGDGSSGIVYQVEYSSQQNQQQISQFAMKVQNYFLSNETEIMRILMNNPSNNLLNIQKYWQSNGKAFIIMDLAADGNLYNFMEQNQKTLTKELKQDIFIQLCLGVQQLHKLNIIHRDLKPENILLQFNPQTQKHTLKICDYGLCKKASITATKNIGTIYYMAPELFKNTGSYTKAIDIWALGCIWYSLVNKNEYLFTGQSKQDILQKITNAKQQNIENAIQKLNLNNWEKNLMKSMISIEFNKRPTIEQILMEINQNKQKPQINQNQQEPMKILQPQQNEQIIQHIQPNQANINPQNQQINKNDQPNQPNQPNIVKVPPQVINNSVENGEIQNLLNNLKKELLQEINLVKQQSVQNFDQILQNQVKKQQTDLDNFQLQNQESIKDQISWLKKTIEIENNNQNSIFDKELALLKQQFTQIQNNQQIENLQNAIGEQNHKYSSILDKEIQQVQQQSEQILKQEKEILKLQESIQQLPTTIENKLYISIQKSDEEIYQLKSQFKQIQQTYPQLQNLQQEMESITNSVDQNLITFNQYVEKYQNSDKLIEKLQQEMESITKSVDSNLITLNKYVEKQQNSDKLIVDLEQKMQELTNTITIQKYDEVIQQLKQQSEQVFKYDTQIYKISEEIKQLPKQMESKTINLIQNIQNYDQQIQELTIQLEQVQKQHDQNIQQLRQQVVKEFLNTFENMKKKLDGEIQILKEQREQILKYVQVQITNLQTTTDEKIIKLTKQCDDNDLKLNSLSEQLKMSDSQEIQNIESKISKINQSQNVNQEEIQQLKQQIAHFLKSQEEQMKILQKSNTQSIQNIKADLQSNLNQNNQQLKQNIEQILNADKQITIIQEQIQELKTNNVKQSSTNSQKTLDSTSLQLQYQLDMIQRSDSQVQKLQQDMKQLKNTIDQRTSYQQQHDSYTKQYQKQEQIIGKLQSEIKELSKTTMDQV